MIKEREILLGLMNKKVSLPVLTAKFSCLNLSELMESFNNYFINDYEYILSDYDFIFNLNILVMDLFKNYVKTEDERYEFRNFINNILLEVKSFLKPYNKREKKKDLLYSNANRLKELLNYDLESIDEYISSNDDEYLDNKIIKFVIQELKNPDYLFRITEVYPELINKVDKNGDKLFISLAKFYLDNINSLSEEDIKYYKRVFTILLESNLLVLKNDELYDIYDFANSIYGRTNDSNVKFLIDSISKHYPNLNGANKINCLDYINIDTPVDIVSKSPNSKVDLRDEFTITIDGLRNTKFVNTLFDDAFILKGKGNDLHLLICIPDVDLIIERDSDIDLFMRSLGESIYIKEYKKALLDYEIAKNVSLSQGMDRNCITFDISMDSDANIKGIDFYKSIINVNYNLTKDTADTFIKHNDFDDRLKVLNKMSDLAKKLCKKRKDFIGNKSSSRVIIDEFNILPDLVTADYFNKNNIIFPYKNYLGKLKSGSRANIVKISNFMNSNELNDESRDMLNSIFDIYNRVFYDTINYGNATYHGEACGSVGNPMREYISLETDRLISDLVIDDKNNLDYWLERINRDCIEYTETSAKIRSLYDSKRGR